MSGERNRIFNTRLIIGVAIVLVGALSLLANLGFHVDIHLWDYWPVILILIGLSMIFKGPEYRSSFSGSIFLVVGILFLLNNFEIIHFGMGIFWSIIIILVGIAILKHGLAGSGGSAPDTDYIDLTAILGGGEHNYTSKQLKGGKVCALMGGAKLDLREADIVDESIVIDIFAMMGGVEILVPVNWQVSVHGVPILGGMDNKTSSRSREDRPELSGTSPKRLVIKGTAIMGGIEVKN